MSKQELDLTKGGLCTEITDPKIISELNKQNPYISKMEETDTYDQDMMNHETYNTSAKRIGQHRAIEIAVWPDDPNKDSPDNPFRVHMRIINGRHRYLQDPNWKRQYYDLSKAPNPVLAYFELRQHFDLQKTATFKERQVMVRQMAMYFMKVEGVPPYECCQKIVDLLVPQGVASESTIIKACPEEFKNKSRSEARSGKTFEKSGKETVDVKRVKEKLGIKEVKFEAENKKLHQELDESLKENAGLHKQLTQLQTEFDEVQSKLRIVSQLETTVEIDDIKVKCVVDATNNKLIVEKV